MRRWGSTIWQARRGRIAVLATLGGIALGIVGPFGSYANDGMPVRIGYWLGLAWLGAALLALGTPPIVRWARRRGWPGLAGMALAAVVLSVPLAAAARLLGTRLWPRYLGGMSAADWYGQTLFVTVLVLALHEALKPRAPALAVAPMPPPAPLPADAVLCLRAEDHYVHVHRAHGSDMRLMTIEQAIARFGAADGARVHRSWWVARAAVVAVEREGRRTTLLLANGLRAPVARNRAPQLAASGWLAAAQ